MPLSPTIVATFSHTVTSAELEGKFTLTPEAGGDNIGISITAGNDKSFTVTLANGASLSKNTTYILAFKKGLSATIDGVTYSLAQDVSVKFTTQNAHTVTFDAKGGREVAAITVSDGETLASPIAPTRVGYTFGGWYKDENLTTTFAFESETIGQDITLYAKWVNQDVSLIAIHVNDIIILFTSDEQTIEVSYGISEFRFKNMVKSSSAIAEDAHTSVKLGETGTLKLSNNSLKIKVSAQDGSASHIYTINVSYTHKVIFEYVDGVILSRESVVKGGKVSAPAAPTRQGYAFGGWYKESSYQNRFNFGSETIDRDITLYAKWVNQDVSLSAIHINDIAVSFASNIQTLEVPYGTSEYRFKNMIKSSNSIVEDVNASARLGETGTLKLSNNSLKIKVSSEDGTASHSYTINVSLTKPTFLSYHENDNLGQAIKDTLLEDFKIGEVSGLLDRVYSYGIGSGVKTSVTVTGGKFTIMKSDLKSSSASSGDKLKISYENGNNGNEMEIGHYAPEKIHVWQDLQAMRMDLSGNYKLMKDITFPTEGQAGSGFPSTGFVPIGTGKTGNPNDGFNYIYIGETFRGTLDGNHKTIKNFVIRNEALEVAGLLGHVEHANKEAEVLKNLTFEDAYVLADAVAGVAVGWLEQGKVVNVGVKNSTNRPDITHSFVKVTGRADITRGADFSRSYASGLVGIVFEGGEVRDCYSQASVEGNSGPIGGLVSAVIGGKVTGHATGSVKSNSQFVGGLVGYARGATIEGYATGDVSSEYRFVGGLVGYMQSSLDIDDNNSNGTITGYATGDVFGRSESVGGLVGSSGTSVVVGYATGNVEGSSIEVGGLVGISYGSVTGYATGNVTGRSRVGGLVGICASSSSSTPIVVGYATGTVKGTGYRIGGLVGRNERGVVLGYATGKVEGTGEGVREDVGGLVGLTYGNDSVQGYARGNVSGASDVGSLSGDGGLKGFYSDKDGESEVTGGTPHVTGLEILVNDGSDGNPKTTRASFEGQPTDRIFRFNDEAESPGRWIWVADGKWPAIDLKFTHEVFKDAKDSGQEQPVDP